MTALRKRDSHLWLRHPEDWYVEPKWVSERLFDAETFDGEVVDPACGLGNIVSAAASKGINAHGFDIVKRWSLCEMEIDFLTVRERCDNIVSNPPFGIAEKFVAHALEIAIYKVAMLLPAAWVQGDKRSRWLETTPLNAVYFITPRPSMPPGPVIEAGEKPGNGATDYAWFVWHRWHHGAPEIRWLRRSVA